MSYDINIGDDSFNYTRNLAKLFYDHIPADEDSGRGGLHALHGIKGKKAARKLRNALEQIERTRYRLGHNAFCHKYDAPNGWGSAAGAIAFLGLLMSACYEHPKKTVRVSA